MTASEGQGAGATRSHLRGSSLLFGGRLLSLGLNFAGQVLTIRYLTQSDYGALAYALSFVSIAASVNLLGLGRAVNRFVPMYEEQGDRRAAAGTLWIAFATVLGLGLALVVATMGVGLASGRLAGDARSAELVLLLILLTPLQALDNLLQGAAAIFLGARAIFFRRHLLGPLLKLAAVVAVITTGTGVRALAIGHLVAGAVGVAAYLFVLRGTLAERGLWGRPKLAAMKLPTRPVFGFALPLLSNDVVLVLKTNLAILALEFFRSTTEVAELRAVLPLAGLISVVLTSFKFLYVPLASRLFGRGDTQSVGELYWRTTLWIGVFSFPVFATCFFLAGPMVEALFGARYAASAGFLAVISVGAYFHALLGLNTYTLQVHGRVRFIAIANGVAVAIGLALNLLLVPRLGGAGGALAVTGTIVAYNVLNQLGLRGCAGVGRVPAACVETWAKIAGAVAVIGLLDGALGLAPLPLFALIALASAVLLSSCRRALDLSNTFPELARVPLVGRFLLGGPSA
jgi:O-antigen/teichoic acid export membrane protein